MKKLILWIGCVFIFTHFSSGQVKFGVYAAGGINGIGSIGDGVPYTNYDKKAAFSIGGLANLQIAKSNFHFQPGLRLSYRPICKIVRSNQSVAEFYSLEIPIVVQYEIKKIFVPYFGYVNSFNTMYVEGSNFFTLGMITGLDAILYKHVIAGVFYSADATPLISEGNIYWYRDYWGFKLGYLF